MYLSDLHTTLKQVLETHYNQDVTNLLIKEKNHILDWKAFEVSGTISNNHKPLSVGYYISFWQTDKNGLSVNLDQLQPLKNQLKALRVGNKLLLSDKSVIQINNLKISYELNQKPMCEIWFGDVDGYWAVLDLETGVIQGSTLTVVEVIN